MLSLGQLESAIRTHPPADAGGASKEGITRRLAIVMLVLFIGVSPRIPIPLHIPGRRFDLRLEDLLLAALYLGWLLVLPLGRRVYRTPLSGVIAGYSLLLLTAAASGVVSGAVSLERTLPFTFKQFEYFLIFFMVANWVRSSSDMRALVGAFLAVGMANAVWVGVQVATGVRHLLFFITPDYTYSDLYQSVHLMEGYGPDLIGEASPLATGMLFLFCGFLAFSCMLFCKGRAKRWLFAALGFSFFTCMVLSASRTSGIAAVAGATALAALARRRRKVGLILVFGVMLAGAVLGAREGSTYDVTQRWARQNIVAGTNDRVENIWKPLLEASESDLGRFLIGFGPGSLGVARGLEETEAHNYYLRVLIESGFLGLVAFTLLLTQVTGQTIKACKRSRVGMGRAVTAAAVAATAGLSAGAMFQDIFFPVIVNELWWVLVGLAMAAYRAELSVGAAPAWNGAWWRSFPALAEARQRRYRLPAGV